MRASGLVACSLVFAALAARADDPPKESATYHDKLYGFAFEAPRFEKAAKTEQAHILSLLGRAKHGFQDNVNIVLQPPTKRKQYVETTRTQLEGLGLTVNATTNTTVSGRDAVIMEYEGAVNGRALHFLVLGVFDDDHVYLLTCTSSRESWEDLEKGFRACLASFKLDDEKF